MIIIYYFLILRILSFTLDKVDHFAKMDAEIQRMPKMAKQKAPTNDMYTYVDFLNYSLFPTFATPAPFISFKKFDLYVS